ncbi:MAG: tetratricopeptide repeat protein [Thermodesulfobacteriota bacterium]|nr:tetratricopeptide repeat protein [Thermodesulfobacteriota bacterium]
MGKNRKKMSGNRDKRRRKDRNRTPATGKVKADQTVAEAMRLYEEGNYRAAEKILQKLSEKFPQDPHVFYHLGVVYKQRGKDSDAASVYERALAADPEHTHALLNLGVLMMEEGDRRGAEESFLRLVAIDPAYSLGWFNLGVLLIDAEEVDRARECLETARTLDPENTGTLFQLANVYLKQKQVDAALPIFEQIIRIVGNDPDFCFNVAMMLQACGAYDAAMQYYEKAGEMRAGLRHLAYNNIGLCLQEQNRFDEAIVFYEKSISADSSYAAAYMNMANVFRHNNQAEKAIEYYKKSVELEPSLVGLNNLAGYLKMECRFDDAYYYTRQMMAHDDLKQPDLATIHDTLIQMCRWEEAVEVMERFKTAEFDPDGRDILAGSFMLFCGITDLSPDELAGLYKQWGSYTEAERAPYQHDLSSRKRKKIRIGYSSPDFKEHSVGYLIKDIIASHNKNEFEIWCYANFNAEQADAFTNEIISHCTTFKFVKHLTDAALAEEIYNDGIDILIDLAGHSAWHRLRAMAYKPAPVQMTYLGFPNSTGLSRIDYRITDRFAEAGPEKDHRYSESLIRLSNCFLSFRGFDGIEPEPPRMKAETDPFVFGCFNNIQKLTPAAVVLWAEILKRTGNSKLYLKAKQLNTPMVWQQIEQAFEKYGVPADRLVCLGYTNTRYEHLRLYNQIDVALDTFPYNGTVTTLEGLWMNTPVLTLVGETHAQRVGYSILKNLGFDELIAHAPEEYVEKAVALYENRHQTFTLKSAVRQRLMASAICNPEVVTREMELYFHDIWRQKTGVRQAGEDAEDMGMEGFISAAGKIRLAMVKYKNGAFQAAVNICEAVIESEADPPAPAYYLLGLASNRLGNSDKALASLQQAISLNPENPDAWQALGEFYIEHNAIDDATRCLVRIRDLKQQKTSRAA